MISVLRRQGPCSIAWLLACLFVFLSASAGAEAPSYADELVDKAEKARLFERRGWLVLVHYKPSILHGLESVIDDPIFFLSKEGKRDPKKEMAETIRSFFRADLENDGHPRCRFIARYEWLKTELGIDESKVPAADCKGFRELMDAARPESAALIFPVAHMNSPASMFGHTLLRIDSASRTKLFSYAINYSAITDETNGLFFAFKGIFGYYRGFFGILPYYEKIKEYSNMEHRDIWEYRLDFTKEEVERIVRHIWELKDVYAEYYFFDENCSYNLLLLLEAARPEADLTETLPAWVIPLDTIRAVRGKGYLGERSFRPSKAARIRGIESVAAPDLKMLASGLAKGERAPEEAASVVGSNDDRIKTFDLAAEYVQYLYAKKKIVKDEYLKRYIEILSARSRLGGPVEYASTEPAPPEDGHGAVRLGVGIGAKAGAVYNNLRLRPANHDLMDPDEGYLPGAAISFLDSELRYDWTERKLSLEDLMFLSITSISAFDGFFRPVSWKVASGLKREEVRKREHRTVLGLNAGPGMSLKFTDALIYGFIEPEVKVGSGLDDGYALGAGVSVGVLAPVSKNWKARVQAKATAFGPGDEHTIVSAELNQLFTMDAGNALRLDIKRERFDGFYSNDVNMSWNWYF